MSIYRTYNWKPCLAGNFYLNFLLKIFLKPHACHFYIRYFVLEQTWFGFVIWNILNPQERLMKGFPLKIVLGMDKTSSTHFSSPHPSLEK